DAASNTAGSHPLVDFIIGDSGAAQMAELVRQRPPADRGTLVAVLESRHSQAPGLGGLEALTPPPRHGGHPGGGGVRATRHPGRPDFGPGPYEAIEEFLAAHPGMFIPDAAREAKFGATFAPLGFLIKS